MDKKLAHNAFPFEEMALKNSEAVHENPFLETRATKFTSDSESDTVEIIDFSLHFSLYKSIMERVISEEVFAIAKEDEEFERKRKRILALTRWKWDQVVDLCSDDDREEDVPIIQAKMKVRVCIHNRNRPMKLLDESDVEVDALFEVFCKCAELNPEPVEEDEPEEHNWIFSADQLGPAMGIIGWNLLATISSSRLRSRSWYWRNVYDSWVWS